MPARLLLDFAPASGLGTKIRREPCRQTGKGSGG
jgi:hypothetical protein